MKSKISILIISSLLAIMIALLTHSFVNAYSICCHWPNNYAYYRYDTSLPDSFKSATDFGANVWTNVISSSWAWYLNYSGSNYIKYGYIDGAGNFLAVTTQIYSTPSYHLISIEIKYDSAENWYTGSGTPSGSQFDLRSTAVHEFGHALGFNHTQSSYCSGGGAGYQDATMCPGQAYGNTYKRTLEYDDINGLVALYP